MKISEFDEVIRQSKSIEAFKPSYEDIVRFHSQATRLLLKIECFALPLELQITNVADDGRYFAYLFKDTSGGTSTQWVATQDVEVLMMFPPQELKNRIAELNTSAPVKKFTKAYPACPLDELKFDIKKVDGKYRIFENGKDWRITFPNLKSARAAVQRELAIARGKQK